MFVDVTIPINDTSTTPPPTYSLASSASSVNEGASVTYNLTTTNVSDGTSLNYSLSGISRERSVSPRTAGDRKGLES